MKEKGARLKGTFFFLRNSRGPMLRHSLNLLKLEIFMVLVDEFLFVFLLSSLIWYI